DAIVDGPVAMIATRADLNGDVLFSAAYRRQSSRVSHWVITAWSGLNDQLVPYIGMIKYFSEMPAMLKNSGKYTTPLTLAIMDLFKGSFVVDEGVVEVDME
ncbi:hypothetical protein PLESTF_001975900, partial [Pleodorina starrii]